jgi:large subunit ribosomal protein L5
MAKSGNKEPTASKAEKTAAKPAAKGGKKAETASASAQPARQYKREQPPRLQKLYETEVKDKLRKEHGFKNVMEVPRLVKITLNMGLGRANQNPKIIESAVEELRAIAGQAPVVTTAKRDIATFKLRRGHKIGVMVTLRGARMWEFLDRFINIALPRVRDFKGVSPRAFDGRGNYSCGVREQIIFPEIEYDRIDSIKGLNVTVVTTANSDAEARSLLEHLGMPFRRAQSAEEGSQA